MYVNILCNVEGKVIRKLLCILKVFFSRTTVDLYMYTVVLQKMFPLQTLHRSGKHLICSQWLTFALH